MIRSFIFQKYIFRSLAVHFFAILSVLILLIWFSRAVGFINYITENGVEVKQFFYLFVLILPWMANYIVPVSLFIATLICYSRFVATNEITVLKSCGLNNQKIAQAAITLGILISFFSYLNSFFIAPYASRQLRISRSQIFNNYTNISFNPKTFETFKKTTIYSHGRKGENLEGIFIYNGCTENYAISITAATGKIKIESADLLLYLKDGTLQRQNCESGKSEILTFESYVLNLNESREEVAKLNWKPNELYLHELLKYNGGISNSESKKLKIELSQRILDPLLNINFVLIVTSILLGGGFRRTKNWLSSLKAILIAVTYMLLSILSFHFIEKNFSMIFLPYLNFLSFFLANLLFLKIR